MKLQHRIIPRLCLALAAAALLAPVVESKAQVQLPTNNFVFNFDTTAPWWGWYGAGLNNNAMEWDGTMDANNSPSSGSVKIVIPWGPNTGRAVTFGNFNLNPGNQYGTGVLLNGRAFSRITAKIRVAADTIPRGTATNTHDFGNIQISLLLAGTPNGGNNPFGGNIVIPITATNSWVSITQTVNQLTFPYESPGCMGVVITKNPQNNWPSNTFTFWVDDVVLERSPSGPPEFPPPALTNPKRSDVTGLSMSQLTTGNNVRALIRTVDPTALGTWWIDNPQPVTYSMGIADMPANGSYQANIFINPDGSANTAPDFQDPNNIFLDIRRNASGTGTASFRVKTNETGGNAMTYFQGIYAAQALTNGNQNQTRVITTPTALGTWGLTFQNNTNVTMFGPGGVSTNFNLPADLAAMFRPTTSMVAYFGFQNNSAADGSLAGIVTNVTIKSGTTTIINDNFPPNYGANQVNADVWTRQSGGNIAGIQVLTNTGWTVTWTATDFGFGPLLSTNLNAPWIDTDGLVGFPATLGANRQLLVPYSYLTDKAFFRLEKRTGTKLLILLPGENFAPGTATGKTGTPTVQASLTPFNVRVVIVDSQFKRAGGLVDTVSLTDPNNLLGDGVTGLTIANRAMVDSVATFSVMFVVPGTTTLTSSDITDPVKTGGPSSSLTGQ